MIVVVVVEYIVFGNIGIVELGVVVCEFVFVGKG